MFHLTGGASLNRGPNLDTAKKGAKEISRIFPQIKGSLNPIRAQTFREKFRAIFTMRSSHQMDYRKLINDDINQLGRLLKGGNSQEILDAIESLEQKITNSHNINVDGQQRVSIGANLQNIKEGIKAEKERHIKFVNDAIIKDAVSETLELNTIIKRAKTNDSQAIDQLDSLFNIIIDKVNAGAPEARKLLDKIVDWRVTGSLGLRRGQKTCVNPILFKLSDRTAYKLGLIYKNDYFATIKNDDEGDNSSGNPKSLDYRVFSKETSDFKAAFFLTIGAEKGRVDAQYELGMLYKDRKSYGWKSDVRARKYNNTAKKWLKKAAKKGMCNAQLELGMLYKKDAYYDIESYEYDYANKWLKKAAKQGSLDAKYHLGDINPNLDKKLKWFEQAATHQEVLDNQDEPTSIVENTQINVFKNESEALVFKKKLDNSEEEFTVKIEKNNRDEWVVKVPYTQYKKFMIYESKRMVAMINGAKQRVSESQYELGMIFVRTGQYTRENYSFAKKWLRKAMEQGHQQAKIEFDKLKSYY